MALGTYQRIIPITLIEARLQMRDQQTSVNNKQTNPVTSFKGRAAAFYFLLAVTIVEMIGFLIFCREAKPAKETNTESCSTSQDDLQVGKSETSKATKV